MTEVALRVVAEAQDRASGVLKSFRGETDRTTESLRKMQKEARTNAEVEGIFIRGKEQKLTALANARREAVIAARAESASTSDTFGKFKGAVASAAKGQELFNKTLGLAGFIGLAAGAVGALAGLIDKATSYRAAINDAKEQQQGFNAKLDELQKRNRDFGISKLADDWKNVAKAQDEVTGLTAVALSNQAMREVAIGGELQATQKIVEAKERLARVEASFGAGTFQSLLILQDIERLEQTRNQLRIQIERSEAQEPGLLDQIKDAQDRSNVSLHAAKLMAADLSGSLNLAQKFAGGLGDALSKSFAKVGWNPFKSEAKDKGDKKPPGGGANAAAAQRAREQSMVRELELARAGSDADRLRIQREHILADVAAKKISALEGQLKIQLQQVGVEREIADFHSKLAEDNAQVEEKTREDAEQTAQKRIAERRKQSEEKLKESKEARTKDLDARALAIENLGETAARADGPLAALSDRLAGLGSTIQQTAGIWASYTRGQTALGDAIAGTIGTIGSQVAQAISDRRAQALVEGGFETAASIASFASGNIPAGIGHAAAAASFFALAAQGGGKGAASGGGGKGAGAAPSNVIQGNFGQSSRSSRPEDTRTVIVHHYGQGIIYGQGSDVARAGRNADRSLAGTGMQNTGY